MINKIEKISIRNYRSISKLDVDNINSFLITCGANNVGKTNFLRALKLFFDKDETCFTPEEDIPFHIYSGTRGAGNKSSVKITFFNTKTSKKYAIEKIFSGTKDEKKLDLKGKSGSQNMSDYEIVEYIDKFKFFFIEASNVNLPSLISSTVNDEILPLGLDRRRGRKQKDSLDKLNEFIDHSKKAVERIEKDMTQILLSFLNSVEYIDTTEWKLKIIFPEYSYLREAISNMISFTLFDSNDRELDAKGSGIQRMILLSLINYIKSKSKKEIIWAIDEPEAFLQPGLQKGLYKELQQISLENQIIIATHSHFFVNIQNLDNTYLFKGTKELKEYRRKPGVHYYKLNTERLAGSEKQITQQIKEHLGIEKNDSWEIQPFNVVVEGKGEIIYFTQLLKALNMSIPNFIAGNGVDKYPGLFVWINEFCSDLDYRPKVLAVFDRDSAGKGVYDKYVNKKSQENFDIEVCYINSYNGNEFTGIELEDFIIPELLYPALNKFLRKKKYRIVKASDRRKRDLPAYNKKPILDFITDIVKQNNEDKDLLDFNNLGLKLVLSEYISKEVAKSKSLVQDLEKYPSMIKFLIKISNMN